MLVCHCKGVNDRTVKRAVREGADCLAGVGRACGAGTGCGGCRGVIEEILVLERVTTVLALELDPLGDTVAA